MNKLLLLLILSGSLLVKAQTPYVKMLGNTTDWYMFQVYIPVSNASKTASPMGHSPMWGKYSAFKDTIVSGKTYKKFYHVYMYPSSMINSHVGYLREDTAARKVYYLDKMNTLEDLIYDFSMIIGDSIYYNFPNTSGTFPKGYYKLLSISTVTTPLGLRNMQKFRFKTGTTTTGDTLRITESIGSEIHPIYINSSFYGPGQLTWGWGGCQYPYYLGLACKYTDSKKIFQSCTFVTAQSMGCIFKYDSCNYWNTCSGINELDLVRNFDISPNPSSGLCTITLELSDQLDITLEVYDVAGRKVKGLQFPSLEQGLHNLRIDLRDYATGLYYIKTSGEGFELHKPLVIEN